MLDRLYLYYNDSKLTSEGTLVYVLCKNDHCGLTVINVK